MKANQASWPVRTICRVLDLSASGYYAWVRREPSARERRDKQLRERITAIWRANREVYGRPRIHAELQAENERVGHKRVARLMKQAGIEGASRRRGPKTTTRGAATRPAPDLVERNFTAAGTDQLWVADIERHEALSNLAVVGGHRHRLVAAGRFEAEGSPNRGTPGKAEAALTTTGRASTVRWCGSGKRDGKVYVRNQRQKTPQAKTTSSNLTDRGWVATHIRPARPVGELLGRSMSPAGRPR